MRVLVMIAALTVRYTCQGIQCLIEYITLCVFGLMLHSHACKRMRMHVLDVHAYVVGLQLQRYIEDRETCMRMCIPTQFAIALISAWTHGHGLEDLDAKQVLRSLLVPVMTWHDMT